MVGVVRERHSGVRKADEGEMMSRYRSIHVMPRGSWLCWPSYWVEGAVSHREGRHLCSSPSNNGNKALEQAVTKEATRDAGGMTREEAYHQINNLNFMTAAKILFTAPPKKKKFGLDFHLVQLFFACMPSLAVYLVAQYARYEIRRMEAEVELKKQAEEEEKARQAEEEAKAKEQEMDTMKDESDQELVKVKVRLDALEEAVKEIADETKSISHGKLTKDQKGEKKAAVLTAERGSLSEGEPNTNEPVRLPVKEEDNSSSPAANTSPENVKNRRERD